jgi:SMC interacting uncharacterized protein involved in chromosome segregation
MDDLLLQLQRLQSEQMLHQSTQSKQDKLYLQRISDLERDLQFFRRRCSELESKFSLVQQKEEQAQQIRSSIEVKVTEEVSRLQQEIDRLRRLLSLSTDDFQKMDGKCTQMEQNYRKATSQIEVLSKLVQEKEAENQSLAADLESKKEAFLREEREGHYEQLKIVKREKHQELLAVIEKKDQESLLMQERFNTELLELKHSHTVEIAKKNDELRKIQMRNAALQETVEMLKIGSDKELVAIKRQLETKHWELEKTQGEFKNILVKIEQLEREHTELVANHASLEDRSKTDSSRIAAYERELNEARSWNAYLNEQIDRLESAPHQKFSDEIQSEFDQLHQKYQSVLHEKEIAIQENLDLKLQLDSLNEKAAKISQSLKNASDVSPVPPISSFPKNSNISDSIKMEFLGKTFKAPQFNNV